LLLAILSAPLAIAAENRNPSPQSVFRVVDFGATADNGKDAGPAVLAAMDAALAADGPTKVVFPRGELIIGSASINDRLFLSIIGRNALTLEGDQTLLILKDSPRATALLIEDFKDITIRGLAFDYDPLPYVSIALAGGR
jgi:hypothetical protein